MRDSKNALPGVSPGTFALSCFDPKFPAPKTADELKRLGYDAIIYLHYIVQVFLILVWKSNIVKITVYLRMEIHCCIIQHDYFVIL